MYVYQTIYRSSVGCMCTWWIPEVGYPSYMYTMYRYIDMDPLVKDRMVAEYLDSCIQCTFSKKKKKGFRTKDSYSVLLFSFLLVIVIVKSIRRIKSNRKKKKRHGKETRQVCSYKNAGLAPNPPCHANIIQLCVVRKTKQVKNRETSRKEKKN